MMHTTEMSEPISFENFITKIFARYQAEASSFVLITKNVWKYETLLAQVLLNILSVGVWRTKNNTEKLARIILDEMDIKKPSGNVIHEAAELLIKKFDKETKKLEAPYYQKNNFTRDYIENAFEFAESEYSELGFNLSKIPSLITLFSLVTVVPMIPIAAREVFLAYKHKRRENFTENSTSIHSILTHMEGDTHSFQSFKILFIKYLLGVESFARLAVEHDWQPHKIYNAALDLLKAQHYSPYTYREIKMMSLRERDTTFFNDIYQQAYKNFFKNSLKEKFRFTLNAPQRIFSIDKSESSLEKAFCQLLFVEHGHFNSSSALKVIFIQKLLNEANIELEELSDQEKVTWFFCYLIKDKIKTSIKNNFNGDDLEKLGLLKEDLKTFFSKKSERQPSIYTIFMEEESILSLDKKTRFAQMIMKTWIKESLKSSETKFDEKKIDSRIARLDTKIVFHFLVEIILEIHNCNITANQEFNKKI